MTWKSSEKIRWGILGCAAIAEKSLIPALKNASGTELLAIASRSATKARDWAEKFSLPKSYGSYEDLLADKEIEAVYIPLPNHLHFEWTIKALRAGKHVLCEKPLALTASQAMEMFDEARANKRQLMEAFMYRFHPRLAKATELLESGAIGESRLVQSAFTFVFNRERDNYRWAPQMGGGALYDVGCYTVNVARLVFKAEPLEIRTASHLDERTGIDLTTSLLCQFSDSRHSLLASSFELEFQSSLKISGREGSLFLNRVFSAKDSPTEIILRQGEKLTSFNFPPVDQYQLMVEHFGQVVSGQVSPLIDFHDSFGNALALEKALKSIRSR
ncbi:MAG TPA: Gfo/Idh/MocA family oxidoreductase [Candidatus Saccharicenans sp.]|nr:Gfo/Idh/MocA family oxidoreductase [Candidatus Saccharicenans sp.]HQO76257.1 Gfo/Idh/MocA family oxidoreductase [Candidatus Saccharicenans sp.]HUM79858.1 Gfo/Idh/MocA family oxidoreductase [Candidatus Saccharicenans sp.]